MSNPVLLKANDSSAQEESLRSTSGALHVVLSDAAILEGYLDGLETLATALNGYVDGLETLLTTQAGYLDGVEAALALLAPTTTAGAGIAPVVSTALETGHVIKASAGNLYRLNGAATTVAGFFLVHNSATVPVAGAVTPVKAYPVAIGQAVEIEFNPPLRLGTGISISFTSAATPFTQTDSATAFISGDAV